MPGARPQDNLPVSRQLRGGPRHRLVAKYQGAAQRNTTASQVLNSGNHRPGCGDVLHHTRCMTFRPSIIHLALAGQCQAQLKTQQTLRSRSSSLKRLQVQVQAGVSSWHSMIRYSLLAAVEACRERLHRRVAARAAGRARRQLEDAKLLGVDHHVALQQLQICSLQTAGCEPDEMRTWAAQPCCVQRPSMQRPGSTDRQRGAEAEKPTCSHDGRG